MKTTTLSALRQYNACKPSYDLIAAHLGKDYEGEISLETALEVLPLKDCIWALRTVEGGAEIAIEFAIRVAYPFGSVEWKLWADRWLSGEDRSIEATHTAARAAYATHTAAHAATAAYYAADAATHAAKDKPTELARQTEILKELLQ